MIQDQKTRRWRALSAISVLLVLLSFILLIIPGPGFRLGLWPFSTARDLMYWAFYIGCGGAALGLLGLLLSLGQKNRIFATRFVVAILVGGGISTSLYLMRANAAGYVPIHDVTTDLIDPPVFVAIPPRVYDPYIVPDRGRADLINLDPEARWRIYHKEAYGDIGPLYLDQDLADAAEATEAVARDMGWEIVAVDSEQGRIEATAQSTWFGFKDDVVIRIRKEADRSRVDVRSVSRIGISDIGVNAKRVQTFLSHLQNKAFQ